MIKAAFFDLDGTLVGESGKYTPAVKTALSALQRKGIRVFAATGRAPYELKSTKMIEGLEFDAIVSLNGQYCYAGDRVIHMQLFDKAEMHRILDRCKKTPFPCAFVEKDEMYINFVDDYVRLALEYLHNPLLPIRNLEEAVQRDVLMIMVFLSPAETEKTLRPILQCSDFFRGSPFTADILPIGGGKCTGIEKVLEQFDLMWDSVIAFGDGENDRQMLEKAGYAVAMGNAIDTLKQGDFYITDSVEHDGVVTALHHFELL